jgi:hypothetical protein
MARKLRCTVTGNWSYCSEERYQKLVTKYGGEKELEAKYVSRQGKKTSEEGGKAPDEFKNKIECTITGELCYISDERMKKLVKKMGSEQAVRDGYVSRVAKRLLKEGKTKTEIKAMAKSGTLPAPTGEPKPVKVKAPKVPKVKKDKAAPDVTKDTNPAAAVLPAAPAAAVAPATVDAAAKKTAKKSAKKSAKKAAH